MKTESQLSTFVNFRYIYKRQIGKPNHKMDLLENETHN